MLCDGVEWTKRCSICTMICYAVTMDENGICPPETPNCMTGLPKCEKKCQDDSCVYVPVPRCKEIRISKQVLLLRLYRNKTFMLLEMF